MCAENTIHYRNEKNECVEALTMADYEDKEGGVSSISLGTTALIALVIVLSMCLLGGLVMFVIMRA